MRLAIVLLFLTAGCASPPYWERTWEGALTTRTHVIDISPYGPNVQGWTVCDKVRRHCDILIVSSVNRQCVEAHEMVHASGVDHPQYRYHLGCP